MTVAPTRADGPVASPDDPGPPVPVWQRPPWRFAAAVVAAWLVPAVTYLLGVAVVVPVVILVATASLMRGGRTLLDRLMLAVCVLLGLTLGGALIFSVWPFGMHPVAIGGVALSGLVVAAWRTGRRPNLPRPGMADLLTLAAAGAVAAFVALPLLRRDEVGRLSIALAGEDISRHLSLFDAIRRLGGYAFERWDAAHTMIYDGMVTYPQGQHMLAAVLDNFVRSSADEYGSGSSALDHYLASHVLGYVLFTLATLWAAQWIAAPVLTPLRRVAVVAVVTAVCVTSDLMGNLVIGYTATVLGLAEMVLLAAVLTRTVASTRQHLVTVACLLTAIGFTYYLYLPAALLATLAWLVVHRRRVLRHRVAVLVVTVVTAPVALLPVTLGLFVAGQAEALLRPGQLRPSRDHLIALTAAVLASVLFTRARRSGLWRNYLLVLASCGVFAGVLLGQHALRGSGNGYYPNKALHLVFVILLVGLGALLSHLPPPRREPDRRRAWLRAVAPGVAVALVVGGAFGLVRGDAPYRPEYGPRWTGTWWYGLRADKADAAALSQLLARYPAGSPEIVIVHDADAVRAYTLTLWLATLERQSARLAPGLYMYDPIDAPNRLDKQVHNLTDPIAIVVYADDTERRARDIARANPDRNIDVVRLGS